MDQLNEIIAGNLVRLRTEAGLTQLQLAGMLNYSDKAVSKWERGESIPDVRVLLQLANIYHITVDDIINPPAESPAKPKLNPGKKRLLITIVSSLLCFFVGAIIWAVLGFVPTTKPYAYLSFLAALIACAIVLTVFSAKWGNRITNTIATSAIVWTVLLTIEVIFRHVVQSEWLVSNMWMLIVAGLIFEALIFFWFILRKVK